MTGLNIDLSMIFEVSIISCVHPLIPDNGHLIRNYPLDKSVTVSVVINMYSIL